MSQILAVQHLVGRHPNADSGVSGAVGGGKGLPPYPFTSCPVCGRASLVKEEPSIGGMVCHAAR